MSNFFIADPNYSQVLTLAANNTATTTAIPNPRFKVMSQVGIHLAVGSAPTATTSSFYVPPDTLTDSITIGIGQKVNVLNATSTANAKVTIYY